MYGGFSCLKQENEKIVVLVRATPEESKKHGYLVCVAGINGQGEGWEETINSMILFRNLLSALFYSVSCLISTLFLSIPNALTSRNIY